MTITLDWTVALALLLWTGLVFWAGRASVRRPGADLSGVPRHMIPPMPDAASANAPVLPQATPPSEGLTPGRMEAIRGALLAKNKIMAIKLYREATGIGLAEAKSAVEAMEQ
ncbi:MAG: ribosomal protein L7/L12 [Novosphingobium sp.]